MKVEDNNDSMKQESVSKDQFPVPNLKKREYSEEEKAKYRACREERVELFNKILRKQMKIREEAKSNKMSYKSALWYVAFNTISVFDNFL